MPSTDSKVSARAFKDLFRHHPAGVGIVTLVDESGSPVGFTATSVISVSADPAILAFSITGTSSSWPALSIARSAVIGFLAQDQAELSTRFATPGIDRFADQDLEWLATGEPRLAAVSDWVRVEIAERIPAGSSFLITAQVTDLGHEASDGDRLVYVDRTYHRTGGHSQVG